MKRTLHVLVVVLGLACGSAAAQDARSVVEAAATTIGAKNLTTIQISGAGWTAASWISLRCVLESP